jgi:ferric-dicitrate binding protein FerR (iron transport regulator)
LAELSSTLSGIIKKVGSSLGEQPTIVVLSKSMQNQQSPFQIRFWNLLSKKLANEATEGELQELQSILLNNPEFHHQADLMDEMWQQESKTNNYTSEAAYMRHVMKHKDEFFAKESHLEAVIEANEEFETEKPSFFRSIFSKRLTIISFIALIILSSSAIYFLSGKKNVTAAAKQEISSVVTKNGNRTKIVLPDGSQVWLNAGSNLDYNNSTFNKELREVSLNGEAYFDVTKNEAKPFIIHTKKMDVRVVGTAFNIRSYNDEKIAEASLIRGSIEVTLKDRKDQKILLKPNEKISINTEEEKQPGLKTNEKIAVKQSPAIPQIVVNELKLNPTNNIIPEIAWTQNRLYFEDQSLEDIAPMLEKWFGKTVIIQNQNLKKIRYTGNFENETIENVLSYLKLSKSFNFKIENESVVIY